MMEDTEAVDEIFHLIAGTSILILATTGFAIRSYIWVRILTKKVTMTSFIYCCWCKSLFDWILCFWFLFWAVPVSLFGEVLIWKNEALNMFGSQYIATACYIAGPMIQVFASLARCTAVFSFYYYDIAFSKNRTLVVLGTIVITCNVWFVRRYVVEDNHYTFQPESLLFDTPNIFKTATFYDYFAITQNIIYWCAGATMILNVITFVKQAQYMKHMSAVSSSSVQARMKQNKIWFTQTVCQDSLFLIDIFFVGYLAVLSSGKWWLFICFTSNWITFNCLDGLIIIGFNHELSEPVFQFLGGMIGTVREKATCVSPSSTSTRVRSFSQN